ncbi:MAG: hypothetical protein LBP60_01290 [Spirochaetaceae bacterium]|nr:hypothetical protein [Spirochaetaceae bacterium]
MNEKDSNNRGRRRPFKKDGRSKEDSRNTNSFWSERRGADSPASREGGPRGNPWKPGDRNQDKRQGGKSRGDPRFYKRVALYDRPRWTAPKLNTDPLPTPGCDICGQPITDMHTALTDKKTGNPVHFDCVMAELMAQETPEKGDVLSYIGGGRFGIVHFNSSGEKKEHGAFTIKKILEWEDKENRAEWRAFIADHYSLT